MENNWVRVLLRNLDPSNSTRQKWDASEDAESGGFIISQWSQILEKGGSWSLEKSKRPVLKNGKKHSSEKFRLIPEKIMKEFCLKATSGCMNKYEVIQNSQHWLLWLNPWATCSEFHVDFALRRRLDLRPPRVTSSLNDSLSQWQWLSFSWGGC